MTPTPPVLARAHSRGGLPGDDALGVVLPLFRLVALTHETGRVAPLRGLGSLFETDGGTLAFGEDDASVPVLDRPAIAAAERTADRAAGAAIEIVRTGTETRDLSGSSEWRGFGGEDGAATDERAANDGHSAGGSSAVMRIVPGWQRWEHLAGHHDQLTDIASLGELLVALLCGLDLADADDASALERHRRNLFALNPRLDPVIAAVAVSMIEPDRRRRAQDLAELVQRLENYRDQPEDFDLDRVLERAASGAANGPAGAHAADRRAVVLDHLRDRLFDLSRRNALLHFRRTQRTLDLTEASFPLVLDVRHVRPDQIFTWGGRVTTKLLGGKAADVGSIVRCEDAPHAAPALDAIISAARRDRAEYGRDQLRLVVAFLRWHNVKEIEGNAAGVGQAINSPLVLAPVTLNRARGVRDSYQLKLSATEAEVNPVLRHQLDELFGLRLPASIDLADARALEDLRASLERQARATQPGLTVTIVDKPRIEVIRHRATVALQAFRRRRPSLRPVIGRRQYAYSYTWPGWSPLGVQVYQDRVVRQPLPLSVELGDRPAPVAKLADQVVVEQETYSVTEGAGNPYAWEVDLCAVTLANFNYRTLSLVRDYEALISAPRANHSFDEVFSTSPRETALSGLEVPLADRYLVVPADDSQLTAIAQARAGDNFVIQGPPGTGKSQTITNLIADYVARGQRVLFVCQKRAALDVVHARLSAQGLGEISTLVHDSQEDKKAFVHALRETYERWLREEEPLTEVEAERDALIAQTGQAFAELAGYESALRRTRGGLPLVTLVERLVARRENPWGEGLSAADRLALPEPGAWVAAREHVQRLQSVLVPAVPDGRDAPDITLARSPLRLVADEVFHDPRADLVVAVAAESAVAAMDALTAVLASGHDAHDGHDGHDGHDAGDLTLAEVVELERVRAVLGPVVARGRAAALDPASSSAADLRRAADDVRRLERTAAAATSAASGWVKPLEAGDARSALAVAQRHEGSFLRFLSSDWRRVRGLVAKGFDPGARAVRPTATESLAILVARHDAETAVELAREDSLEVWGHENPAELAAQLELIGREGGRVGQWRDRIAAGTAGDLSLLGPRVDAVRAALDPVFAPATAAGLSIGTGPGAPTGALGPSLRQLRSELALLAGPAGQALVRAAAPIVRELLATSDARDASGATGAPRVPGPGPAATDPAAGRSVLGALRRFDASPEQLEYAVLTAELLRARAEDPTLERLDAVRLGRLVERITGRLADLRAVNARVVNTRIRHWFVEVAALSRRSSTGMTDTQRAVKKIWATGRRELEHEFGKVRAYKSIRQLASGESGQVVAALRPVWLMSPSSLSDTLPLAEIFDVVIFDEASQIPVEEAVPALFRAKQAVVVGDRMQLPPTQYFQARTRSDDPSQPDSTQPRAAYDDLEPEDQADALGNGVILDADSFLSVGSVRLPSTMLLWHYRSRHEALIQFSNAAFYEGRLATIPDRTLSRLRAEPMEFTVAAAAGSGADDREAPDVVAAVDGLFERSISSMRLLDGVYAQRRNPAEAVWIARLVRELLARETGMTLGIVAFSEAQQGEIERALEALAREDAEFGRRYEAESAREEDGQAVGLFVKNLENVQGDERDIVLMSVCYAPDPEGRMRMNFGPINTAGGERRLNVIFSRAKHHMVVVTSIDHTAITNVYNDGANALKNFLHYAESISNGDDAAAERVLATVRARVAVGAERLATPPESVVQLEAALRDAGLVAVAGHGQSSFRCDLAVRRPDDAVYRVAVLVDHDVRLAGRTLDERRVTQPEALRSAGWRVVHVPLTAWQANPQDVVGLVAEAVTQAAMAEVQPAVQPADVQQADVQPADVQPADVQPVDAVGDTGPAGAEGVSP